jgi:S-ribosylhomocysteine lyase
MKKIASFCVDHTKLRPGVYLSRVDGDIVTYDIRMRRPNHPPYLENAVMHTIEHLFATYARNSAFADSVIYFGPMGCRTGFYFLLRNVPHSDALSLIREIFCSIARGNDQVPGCTAVECGNYLEHDHAGAIREAQSFLAILENWDEKQLQYE